MEFRTLATQNPSQITQKEPELLPKHVVTETEETRGWQQSGEKEQKSHL